MKQYLTYLFVRLFAGILIISIIIFGNNLFTKTKTTNNCEETELLILGDSHFNGIGLPNALHLGQDSDTYYTMYNKLLSTSSSCDLRGVVVSLSYINLSKNYFDIFLRTDANQSYSLATRNMSYANLFSLMKEGISWSSVLKVFTRNKFSLSDQSLVSIFTKNESDKAVNPQDYVFDNEAHIERLRQAQANKKRKIRVNAVGYKNKIKKSIDRLFVADGGMVSTWNLEYLNKIIEHCDTHSMNLYLVNTPLELSYNSLIPSKFKSALEDVIKNASLGRSNIQYIDLTNRFISSDYFIDEHHVTQYGAALISEEIRKIMVN